MSRSCLQCWVSDQGWRMRAYNFMDLAGPLAVDSKSSSNIFWADLPETRCHGLGISSSILDRREEGIKHGHSRIELLAPPSQHRTRAEQEIGEDSRTMDGRSDLKVAIPKRAPYQFFERRPKSRIRVTESWAQEAAQVEAGMKRCPGSDAARSLNCQSCTGSLRRHLLTGRRGLLGTNLPGRTAA